MPTLEQMMATAHHFTTNSGVDYLLPRFSIKTRRSALAFVGAVEDLQKQGVSIDEARGMEVVLGELVNLLQAWLVGLNADITIEKIEDDWDISDIPRLMDIINGNESEVQKALPPDSPSRKRAKPTGEKSRAASVSASHRID
jgi:hypothetical protein